MKNEKLVHSRPDVGLELKRTYLPKHVGDNKYVEKMVPGYTGRTSSRFIISFLSTTAI